MNVFITGMTNMGKVRNNNEDNFYINGTYRKDISKPLYSFGDMTKRERHVLAVCDGMGGESLGELASLRAVETLYRADIAELFRAPKDIMQKANMTICDEMKKRDGLRMGTTASVLMFEGYVCSICHIGDSRIYRLRNGVLTQLTKDHTRVQQMIDMGIIKKEDAAKHKQKHVLTQHLGIFPEEFLIEPQVVQDLEVYHGDVYLLCSDGLTDMLCDDEIESILIENVEGSVTKTASRLIQAALDQGGKDNVTVVLAQII